MKKKTRMLAYCASISALSVTLLLLGSLLSVLDITSATIASFAVVLTVCEFGKRYAFSIYAVTAILSAILAPQSYAVIFYIGFFGYYPILKSLCEIKIKPKMLCMTAKFVCFFISYALELYLSIKLFGAESYAKAYLVLLTALGIIFFFVYDITLSKLIIFYYRKLRKRLNIQKLFR